MNLESLTREFGADWAKISILPRVLQMANSPNYLYRMTVLFGVAVQTFFESTDRSVWPVLSLSTLSQLTSFLSSMNWNTIQSQTSDSTSQRLINVASLENLLT
jgi:hypothetical protein